MLLSICGERQYCIKWWAGFLIDSRNKWNTNTKYITFNYICTYTPSLTGLFKPADKKHLYNVQKLYCSWLPSIISQWGTFILKVHCRVCATLTFDNVPLCWFWIAYDKHNMVLILFLAVSLLAIMYDNYYYRYSRYCLCYECMMCCSTSHEKPSGQIWNVEFGSTFL